MKRLDTYRFAVVVALAGLLTSGVARAANTDPFDFDYEIIGGITERPALIFNDGEKTYIQPRAGQVITADGGHSEGPYVVVNGTPDSITYSVAGHEATARWNRANTFIGAADALSIPRTVQPEAVSNRLTLIGSHGKLDTTRPLNATMPVAAIVKAPVPAGWGGTAQKDVDLTGASTFETQAGENWMQALDRLMTQTGLYADVDFDTHHVRLHRDPPDGAGALETVVADTSRAAGAPAQPAAPAAPAQPSLLAENFGAQAIRDADDAHTQIRFANKPAKELTFRTPEGKSLHPKWDDATNVVTIERADRFTVSDGSSSVNMIRTAGTVYDFDRASPARLEAVFDNDGQTYFKFAGAVIHATVADVRHLGSGEQKGRYYRFNGTADQFIVTADGSTLNVTRRHDVKYTEEPGASGPAPATATAMVKP
jgi:hypothetical protein